MPHTEHTIPIHPLAPAKVPAGAPCNGCGVCCLLEPCPVGILLSGCRSGSCRALRWEEALVQYRCGAMVATREVLAQALPRGTRWLAPALTPLLRRLGSRWIAVGIGCDSHLDVVRTPAAADAPALPAATIKTSEAPADTRVLTHPPHHD